LDNGYRVWPYFGGLGDENVFEKYDITHIVLTSPGDRDLLGDEYEETLANMHKVTTYPILNAHADVMTVYRLPEVVGGRTIHQYTPSGFEMAVKLAVEGNSEKALALAQQHIGERTDHADGHFLAGLLLLQSREYERALAELSDAIRLRGERPRYYRPLANVLRGLGRNAEADAVEEVANRLNARKAEARGSTEQARTF
jgi:tetratricopeptide (TPR) repeat protein